MSNIRTSIRTVVVVLVLAIGFTTLGAFAPAALSQAQSGSLAYAPAIQASTEAMEAYGAERRDGVATEPFVRTELFFGTDKPDGTVVSDKEFQQFLDKEITPRFPDGLTLVSGYGQFRNSQGVIDQEGSKLLILLYPAQDARRHSGEIEEIREEYKQQFQQESVLRVDERLPARVSF